MNILNNPSKFQDFHAIEVVLEPSTWIIALNFEAQITTRTSWKWLGPLLLPCLFLPFDTFLPQKKHQNPGPHPPSIKTEAASFGGAVGSKVVVSAVSSSHSRDLRPTVAMGWSVENSAWKKSSSGNGMLKKLFNYVLYIYIYIFTYVDTIYQYVIICVYKYMHVCV